MIEEKKTCGNCGASYEIKHDLPEDCLLYTSDAADE